ncbi:hypothetical protein HK101_002332, partial [Irineochytrium annulatum]
MRVGWASTGSGTDGGRRIPNFTAGSSVFTTAGAGSGRDERKNRGGAAGALAIFTTGGASIESDNRMLKWKARAEACAKTAWVALAEVGRRFDQFDQARCGHRAGPAVTAFLKALVMALVCHFSNSITLFSLAGLWAVNAFDVALLLTASRREMPWLIPFLIVGTFIANPGPNGLQPVADLEFMPIQAVDVAATYFIIAKGAPEYKDLATARTAIFIVIGSCVGPLLFATLGSVFVVRLTNGDWSTFSFDFIRIFCSDGIGMVMIIPFILSLNPTHLSRAYRSGLNSCLLALLCLLFIVSIELGLPFAQQSLFTQNQLRFLAHSMDLPIVIFAGFLVGNLGFTLSTLAMGLTAVASTVFFNSSGPLRQLDPVLLSELLRLQIVMLVVELASLTSMIIQAQRDRALEVSDSAARHKSAFMAFLCHELRNPLHAIMNISSFVADSELDPEQAKLCEAIRASSSYMSELLNDVLDTTKLEAGKLELRPLPVNVYDIITAVLTPFKEDIKNRSLTFWAEIGDLNICLELDTMRVKQVINNLLSNAIKFTPENGEIIFRARLETEPVTRSKSVIIKKPSNTNIPTISSPANAFDTNINDEEAGDATAPTATVTVAIPPPTLSTTTTSATLATPDPLTSLNPTLVIQVSDNGVGMRPDVLERLFRPYEQLSTAHREYGGTGLGLSICKQLVDLMRGSITVESQDGKGTTFT